MRRWCVRVTHGTVPVPAVTARRLGHALLELPGGGAVSALSTLTGVTLVQTAVAEASALLLPAGENPPVYVSANVPGGFEGNLELEKKYAGRIRRTAS